jgi:ankyrin repeat protein
VRNGNIKDSKKLIAAGANVNLPDKYGHTPAHVAAIKTGLTDRAMADHFFKLLTLLKESGTDLSLKDYRGRTVEDCLKMFGNRAMK